MYVRAGRRAAAKRRHIAGDGARSERRHHSGCARDARAGRSAGRDRGAVDGRAWRSGVHRSSARALHRSAASSRDSRLARSKTCGSGRVHRGGNCGCRLRDMRKTCRSAQDGRERALDPRSGAFATVLSSDQIDALPDDPDEMEAALKEMAGPGRGDPRRWFSRRQAAAEIADPRHPLPARYIRGGEPRRRPRVRRHHDQSRRRTAARHGGLHISRRIAQRA